MGCAQVRRAEPLINREIMDATQLLKKQHAEVKGLFGEFESAKNIAEKQELFEKIADDLAAHCTIEEKVFYPAVYVGPLKDKLREAVEEHLGAKRLIADLLDLEPEDGQFDAKMKALQDQVEHHVEEEERTIFPEVKRNFSTDELSSLGEQMSQMFDELQESEPRKAVPEETEAAARLD
jgi:iron-sulfur cluster repair protein YtfE (RIC family)